jgi:hypothetical protein
MTSHHIDLYILIRLIEKRTSKRRKMMINPYLAQIITTDYLREAENSRLIQAAIRVRKNKTRQQMVKFACRFGLTKNC